MLKKEEELACLVLIVRQLPVTLILAKLHFVVERAPFRC